MSDIVAEARTWLGVRWHHQGRTRLGVDCAGLVIEVAKARRASTFDMTDYTRFTSKDTMVQLCRTYMEEVQHPEVGGAVVFHFDGQRHIALVGDYLYGGLSLIHAYAPARKVVENRYDDLWRKRAIGNFKFKDV